jgi:hypothetical protein
MKTPKKQGATAEETALKETSIAQWNDYVGRFRPAEAALAKKAELTSGERASVKGQASADTAAAFKGLNRETIAAGGQTGANANSGKTKLSLAGNAEAQGKARGLSGAIAETGAEIDSDQQKVGITALGRNIAANATADLARGARRATNVALASAAARHQKNEAAILGVASVAGAAARKFDVFGIEKRADNKAIDRELNVSGIFDNAELF